MDFDKFAEGGADTDPTDPIALYDGLDPQATHVDLRPSQIQILQAWAQRRGERDLVLKLTTGAGKTTVGLVVLYSHMVETQRPCMFLCPTNQLVEQVIQESKRCGVPAVPVLGGQEIPPEALSGSAIVVTSIQSIFHARAGRFESAEFYAILVDDAHAAVGIVRQQFTVEFPRKDDIFKRLLGLFRDALRAQNMGSAAEVEEDIAIGAVEVPYWVWAEHIETVTAMLTERVKAEDALFRAKKGSSTDGLPLRWGLIKNLMHGCRCFFSAKNLQISPEIPPVERVRTYERAERRIFMSATIADESVLVRELGCSADAAARPLEVPDAGGIGERMVLVPRLMTSKAAESLSWNELSLLSQRVAKRHAVVVLTPSTAAAKKWAVVGARVVDHSEDVPDAVQALREGRARFVVFANRYDGLDLPDDACRLLVLDGAPVAYSLMDQVDLVCRGAGSRRRQAVMHKVEQGMGRAVRSVADYAAVILFGDDLVRLVSMPQTRQDFTAQTGRQIDLGLKIAADVREREALRDELEKLIGQCLSRDPGWKRAYQRHAKSKGTGDRPADHGQRIEQGAAERQAWNFHTSNRGRDGAQSIRRFLNSHAIDEYAKAFLLQRVAWYLRADDPAESLSVQTMAREVDHQLLLPPAGVTFRKPIVSVRPSAERFTAWLNDFSHVNGAVAVVEELRSALTFAPDHPHEKFEQGLCDLGDILGFHARRPDREAGVGPDVLWLDSGVVAPLEAKNRMKESTECISKHVAGQLMQAEAWTTQMFPEIPVVVPISVHRATRCCKHAVLPLGARILTPELLNSLLDDIKNCIATLAACGTPISASAAAAELSAKRLGLADIVKHRVAKART